MLRGSMVIVALVALGSGCSSEVMDPGDPIDPIDIDACPAGGTLRVTLWDVYATPRRPDGDVWDGVSAGTIELACSVSAELLRQRLRDAINAELPGVGTAADRFAGEAFEQEIADLCGLAGNWLQMSYEGPDLIAVGGFDTDADWRWETFEAPDTWSARMNITTTGAPAAWEIACDAADQVAVLGVIDRDLAFDDRVGVVGLNLSSIPESAICNGWAYYPGLEGIAGVLVRLDVSGAVPSCP